VIVAGGEVSGQGTALLGITKSVSLPPPPEAAPGEPFTYFLSYSCSSLTVDCVGATITDVIPPQLSRQVSDVRFGGNFQSVNYDASTGTAVFTLFSPLPAGTTAQVAISAQFPPGTAVGTQAVNQATMSASNANPVTSNQVIVTARAQSDWTVTKNVVPAGTPPQVDTPFTYRVGLTLAAGGTQNLNGVTFVDTLPQGAQFVSATGGGTFNAATNQVTWPPRDLVPNANQDVTELEEVTVIFPAANFPLGTTILNVVQAFGTPAGEPTQELGRAERPGIIRGAGTVTAGSKRAGLPEIGPGQIDTYTLTAENPNATVVAGFRVLETLPPQLVMAQDGSPNISGTGPPPVSITATPGGNVPISGGATWTATAPASTATLLFDFGDAPPNFRSEILVRAGIPANSIDRDGLPIVPGSAIENCIDLSGSGTINIRRCTTQTIVPVSVEFSKIITTSNVTVPGTTASWEVGVAVPATSAGDLVNPTITDCLPPGLDLLDPFNPANPINGTSSGFSVAPTITRIPNGCGGFGTQVLITWSWTGGFTLARGQSGTFTLNTLVAPGTPPSSVQNVASLTSESLGTSLQRIADMAITSETLLRGTKEVRGDRDTGFLTFPVVGNTTRGGTATYRATIRNVSDVPVTNVVVLDTMPIPGDIGLKDFTARASEWQPLFAGQLTSNPPFQTVEYSTAHNPCREILKVFPPGCVAPNWSTTPPADLHSVGAIKVDFGSMVLGPNDSISFTWVVDTPVDAPVGAVAWNSFGYVATRVDNGSQLESAEPQKVGLQVEGPGPGPPGPGLPGTGSSSDVFAYIAIVLILGGAVLTLYRRRPSARGASS
jgi:LPXTG-motif cell wall-anchored protein